MVRSITANDSPGVRIFDWKPLTTEPFDLGHVIRVKESELELGRIDQRHSGVHR